MKKAHSAKESFLPPLWVLTLAVLIGMVWLLHELKEIVVLLVVGYCIAYLMDPLLRWGESRGVRRMIGFFSILGVLAIGATLMVLTVVPLLAREYEALSTNLPSYLETVRQRIWPYLERFELVDPVQPGEPPAAALSSLVGHLPPVSGDTLNKILAAIGGTLLQGYSITLTLINLFLLPFIAFYLAVDLPRIHRTMLDFVPGQYRPTVRKLAEEIDVYVSAFVRGQFTVCAILFVLYAIGLWVLGVELWFLLAIVAGFGNIVPYLGFLIGIVLASLMAIVTFGSWFAVVKVWTLFAVVQFLEGTFITPKVLGEKTGLSPLIVILAIFAGGQLFGLLGVFLAVPGAAVVKVLGAHAHRWVLKRL